jgi:hypothetical protein
MDYDYQNNSDEAAENPETHGPMAMLISRLLNARNTAHMWHWKTKSFSQHLALGDLYEQLLELTDELFEIYMGLYGTDAHVELSETNGFSEKDPLEFIHQLSTVLKEFETQIPQDGMLVNKYQELQGLVARTAYKLENLK